MKHSEFQHKLIYGLFYDSFEYQINNRDYLRVNIKRPERIRAGAASSFPGSHLPRKTARLGSCVEDAIAPVQVGHGRAGRAADGASQPEHGRHGRGTLANIEPNDTIDHGHSIQGHRGRAGHLRPLAAIVVEDPSIRAHGPDV